MAMDGETRALNDGRDKQCVAVAYKCASRDEGKLAESMKRAQRKITRHVGG